MKIFMEQGDNDKNDKNKMLTHDGLSNKTYVTHFKYSIVIKELHFQMQPTHLYSYYLKATDSEVFKILFISRDIEHAPYEDRSMFHCMHLGLRHLNTTNLLLQKVTFTSKSPLSFDPSFPLLNRANGT